MVRRVIYGNEKKTKRSAPPAEEEAFKQPLSLAATWGTNDAHPDLTAFPLALCELNWLPCCHSFIYPFTHPLIH